MRAEYLVVLTIKEGMAAPTIEAVGAALEVGTDDPPAEMGFDAVEQIVVKEPRRGFTLDEREFATVLAGLRFWQREGMEYAGLVPEQDVADNGGTLKPLTAAEIDALCERLNIEPVDATTKSNVVTYQSSPENEAEIAWWQEQGWTWEYPGFLQAPNTPGFNFTVGLDDDDARYVVQITTEDGRSVGDEFFNESNTGDYQEREQVLNCLAAFKQLKGIA